MPVRFPVSRPALAALSLAALVARPVAADPAAVPGSSSAPVEDHKLVASPTLQNEAQLLVHVLDGYNYNHAAVHESDFGEVIPDYMQALDSQHLFFLASDKAAFMSKYNANVVYANLAYLGNLDPAFDIYNVYEERVRDRVAWILRTLDGPIDLDDHETYAADRSKSEWPATSADADDLWRKRLEWEVGSELLNHKPAAKTVAAAGAARATATARAATASPAADAAPSDDVAVDPKALADAKAEVRKQYSGMLAHMNQTDVDDLADLYLTAVTGLYDPHSAYMSPESFEDFGIQMKLQLVGIGAVLELDDPYCVVKELVPGGPADLSHQIKPEDRIVAVGQEGHEPVDIIGMRLRSIVDLIRGEKGTKVHLIIEPAGSSGTGVKKDVVIVRDVVKLDSARAHGAVFQVPNGHGGTVPFGVISLPEFYADDPSGGGQKFSASADVAELIGRMKAVGIRGLVLDLRHNGGGFLSEAINLAGLFLPHGPVVQVRDSTGAIQVDDDDNSNIAYTGPLAVLEDRFSASASEIVAGALQNYGRAIIIGDASTHGKGTVQTILEMKSLSEALAYSGEKTGAAKITIQKFYLPNGSSTQLDGVHADIVLPSIDEYLPIGESSLPHALIWDRIGSTHFDGQPLDPKVVDALRQDSLARQAKLAEFAYLRREVSWFKQHEDEENDLPLDLGERKAEQQSEEAFRKQMDAERAKIALTDFPYKEFRLGPPPPPAPKAAPDDDDTLDDTELSTDEDQPYKADVDLREALRVLGDAITLGQNRTYWASDHAPLTVAAANP